MKMIHVTPVPGKVILNPDNGFKHLAKEGEMVPSSVYWTQRIDEGGVTVSGGAPAPAKVATPAPAKTPAPRAASPAPAPKE